MSDGFAGIEAAVGKLCVADPPDVLQGAVVRIAIFKNDALVIEGVGNEELGEEFCQAQLGSFAVDNDAELGRTAGFAHGQFWPAFVKDFARGCNGIIGELRNGNRYFHTGNGMPGR